MTDNRIRLAIYGASVTAQSGESGYVTHLIERLAKDGVTVEKVAYPACHFNDAGFFRVADVLRGNYHVCLFEWNSTYAGSFAKEKLNYVVFSLLKAGVLPVFLIFPRTDTNIGVDREAEVQVQQLASACMLPLLDIRGNVDPDLHLRDYVHTNEAGARLYAGLIHDFLQAQRLLAASPAVPPAQEVHEFFLDSRVLELVITQERPLRLGLRRCGAYPELLLHLTVGPYSPTAIVKRNQEEVRRQPLFDPWCHYEREMYYTFLCPWHMVEDRCEIEISIEPARPDYSIVLKQPFAWDGELLIPVKTLHAADLIVEPLA